MANIVVPTKSLRISYMDVDQFCIHPDGTYAYFFPGLVPLYLVDLATGQHWGIDQFGDRRSNVSFKTGNCMPTFNAVLRSSKLFIYSLCRDSDFMNTKRNFVVSWSINDNNLFFIAEHYIGIDSVDRPLFQQVAKGQIVVVSHYYKSSNTIFDVAIIDFDERGKITSKIVVRNGSLNGNWTEPFLHGGYLYWRPLSAFDSLSKLLKISVNKGSSMEITVRNDIADYPTYQTHFTKPEVIDNYIFCYAFKKESKFGMLLKLDLEERCWQKVGIKMNGHKITKIPELRHSDNGSLYLAGICENDTCEEKTHFYIIDIRTELKRANKPSAEATANAFAYNLCSDTFGKITPKEMHQDKAKHTKFSPKNYEKREQLGAGGFGEVFKCWDKDEHRFFAAKKTLLNTLESKKMAEEEIKTLKSLNHPRIIEYFGCNIHQYSVIIFMEYMPAGSLRGIIEKQGPIGEQKTIEYIEHVLDGLTYVHMKGIVHADLKCENLLLDGHGNLKLADFGIAVALLLNESTNSSLRCSAAILGTLYWMAPEILRREKFGRRADVWSLGCTTVEMLSGEPPHGKMRDYEFMPGLANKTLSYNPSEIVPRASNRMKDFLSNLLQFDAATRPRSVKTMEIFKKLFA